MELGLVIRVGGFVGLGLWVGVGGGREGRDG